MKILKSVLWRMIVLSFCLLFSCCKRCHDEDAELRIIDFNKYTLMVVLIMKPDPAHYFEAKFVSVLDEKLNSKAQIRLMIDGKTVSSL